MGGFADLAALGLALRWTIALRDIDVVDRFFIPDDAYYTLTIARSLALGLGPRADPEVLTTGFQPLLAFLQVPLFRMTSSPDAPLRATLLGLAVADVALARGAAPAPDAARRLLRSALAADLRCSRASMRRSSSRCSARASSPAASAAASR